MSSPAIKNSGKLSGHKSNFSQTCNLLSQYLREKGSFGDLSLGLSPNFQQHGQVAASPSSFSPAPGPTTMNLLPMIEKAGQDPTREVSEPERAQMTIFYGGQVIVFNDVPADKAKEIMGMACQKQPESATNVVPAPAPWTPHMPPQPLANKGKGLPIMRNASLARFFEKRKDRITARAPYQMHNSIGATSKHDKKNTWLGFGGEASSTNGPVEKAFL